MFFMFFFPMISTYFNHVIPSTPATCCGLECNKKGRRLPSGERRLVTSGRRIWHLWITWSISSPKMGVDLRPAKTLVPGRCGMMWVQLWPEIPVISQLSPIYGMIPPFITTMSSFVMKIAIWLLPSQDCVWGDRRLAMNRNGDWINKRVATTEVLYPTIWGYPLVNLHSYGKSPFWMGKSTTNGNFQ